MSGSDLIKHTYSDTSQLIANEFFPTAVVQQTNMSVNIGGLWKSVVNEYVNVTGTWKPVVAVYTNVSGVWKS